MPKIKNIIIFGAIGIAFVLIYIFFIKPSSNNNTPALVSSGTAPVTGNTVTSNANPLVAQDFLNLLLNIQSIKLDDSILTDPAFSSLHDSSITLTPDGTEGRPNPFAPLGTDVVAIPPLVCTSPKVLDAVKNTCVAPMICTSPKVLDVPTNTCVNPPSN